MTYGLDTFIRIDEAGRHQVYRLRDGRFPEDIGEPFATPREAIDYSNALEARAPRPVNHPDLARAVWGGAESRDEVGSPAEAPVASSAPGTCAGCGGPVPVGRRGQRRATCSTACRKAVSRQSAGPLAAATPQVDMDATSPHVTPSRASSLAAPGLTARRVGPGAVPSESAAPG